MQKTDKLSINIDFKWIYTGDSELCKDILCDSVPGEDNQKYRTFLKKMYLSCTNPSLLLKEDEIEFLKRINN
jgi:hypothetical protein